MGIRYLLGVALGTGALAISGCGNTSLVSSLGDGGGRAACYYMPKSDIDGAINVFREIAETGIPRDVWFEWNGHPCDSFPDLESNVPREDCVACVEYVSRAAGWE